MTSLGALRRVGVPDIGSRTLSDSDRGSSVKYTERAPVYEVERLARIEARHGTGSRHIDVLYKASHSTHSFLQSIEAL